MTRYNNCLPSQMHKSKSTPHLYHNSRRKSKFVPKTDFRIRGSKVEDFISVLK